MDLFSEWRFGHQPGGDRREGRRRRAEPAPLHTVGAAQRPRRPERPPAQRRRAPRGQRPEVARPLSHRRGGHPERPADECPAGVRQVKADGRSDRPGKDPFVSNGSTYSFWT